MMSIVYRGWSRAMCARLVSAGPPARLTVNCNSGSPKPIDDEVGVVGTPATCASRWPTGRKSENVEDRPCTGRTLWTPASAIMPSMLAVGSTVCAGSSGLLLPVVNIGQKVTAFAPASVFQ